MNRKTTTWIALAAGLVSLNYGAQETRMSRPACHTDEAMAEYYKAHPEAEKEAIAFEKYTEEFTKTFTAAKASANCYVIPVVFHVYGTTQGGYPVNLSIIQGALNNWVNKDFHVAMTI